MLFNINLIVNLQLLNVIRTSILVEFKIPNFPNLNHVHMISLD